MEEDTLLVCRKSKENPRKSAIRLIRFLTSYTTIDEAHFLHLMLQLYRTFSVLTAPVGHLIFGRVSFWFLHKEKHLNSVEESLFPLLENLQCYFAFFCMLHKRQFYHEFSAEVFPDPIAKNLCQRQSLLSSAFPRWRAHQVTQVTRLYNHLIRCSLLAENLDTKSNLLHFEVYEFEISAKMVVCQ